MRAHGSARSWRSRRLRRRFLVAGVTALVLSAVAGVFGVPFISRHVAEQRLGRWLGRTVTIERLRVNPFALSLTADGLKVLEPDGRTAFAGCRRLYVNAELVSLFRRALVVREIRLESPRVRLVRLQAPDGAWSDGAVYNVSDIVARLSKSSNQPASEVLLPRFSLGDIRVTDGAFVFDDLPLREHHEVTAFTLAVPFLSTLPGDVDTFVAPGMRGRLDGRPFAVEGRSKLFKDTIESVVQVRLNALDLTRYLPYVPLPLPVAVSSAFLTVAVDVSVARPRAEAPRLSLEGKVELADVSLRATDPAARPLVDLGKLTVMVGNADFTDRRFSIDQVLVSRLEVHARRSRDGTWDLSRLLPATASTPAAGRATLAPAPWTVEKRPQWSVGLLQVETSALTLRDETVQPPFEGTARDISLSVAHLSNVRGAEASVEVAFLASPGGKFVGHGRLGLDPLASTGTVSVEGLEPGRFAAYYDTQVGFGIAGGLLSFGSSYELGERRDHLALHLREGGLTMQHLALRRPGARSDFLRLPQLAARGIDVDFDRRTISAGGVNSRAGHLALTRDQRGIVDLAALGASWSSSPTGRPSAPPWAISVARLDLEKWTVLLEDRVVSPPAILALAPLALHATSLSTAPDGHGSVDLRFGLNKTGHLALSGPLSLNPPAANLRVDLRAVDLVPLQSYWRDRTSLVATSGLVSFKGQVRVETSPRGAGPAPNAPPPEPRVRLIGDVAIADLAAIDAEKKESLFWSRSLRLDGLELATVPFRLAVREATLSDFGAQLIVFSDGRFNFAHAFGPSTKAPVPPSALPKLSVGQLKLDGGQIRFTDRLIRPRTSIALAELEARVSGLSSSAGTRAEVDLRGRLDHVAPLTVAGRVNPLAKQLFVDLKGALKDFDLTAASPYAVKYLGHGIRKGQLSLDVAYHVRQGKLDADNHVVLAALRFGEKVPGPDASNLPVKLAATLLEDRRGIIDVSLPVSGALDDPGFAFWSSIGKALRNRVLAAATLAPFSLIAKAFGSPEELSRVEFPAGLAILDGKARNKLATLAKALEERRELSFEIQGGTDPERDREGLRRDLFERKLRLQKRAELARQGVTGRAVDEVRFAPGERARLLAAAYQAETFAKPRNFLGFVRSLPAEEMEKLMMAHLGVRDEDLRALAVRRASVVKEALATQAPAVAGRLFVVNPFLSGGTSVELKLRTE